jgi:hypothetical protein
MRRIALKLAVALLAFVIGLAVFIMWRNSPALSYCEVAQHGHWYHNTIVRVRATLIFGSGGMYIYEDCDPVEALASLVELEGASGSNTVGYVEELLVQGNDSSLKKVDAVIEGRFDANFSMGCFGPKYHIAARKIQLLSPVTDYVPPDVGRERLRIKH